MTKEQLAARQWKKCAEKLRVFAIAYRTHPLRNPNDKLDEALAAFDLLVHHYASVQLVRCPICDVKFRANAGGALVLIGAIDVIRCPQCLRRERIA